MSLGDPTATFRIEAQELLDTIEQGLLDLGQRPDDIERVSAVFRALHTLKGSGAMFGFDALAEFTHHCETAFDRVRKGECAATPMLIRAVLDAQDHMRALAEQRPTQAGAGDALLANLHRATANAQPADKVGPPQTTYKITFRLPADCLRNGTRPLSLLDELRGLGTCQVTADIDAVPTLEQLDPTDCLVGWTVILSTDKPRSDIDDVFLFALDDMTLDVETLDAGTEAVGQTADALDTPGPSLSQREAANDSKPAPGHGDIVRVPAERLDELMNRVGELVIAQSRLTQIAGASHDVQLRSVAEEIERLSAELRDTMMVVRMVPISSLFGRFRRLVHDLSVETGKTIALETTGGATELDKTVIERLADPMIHLIRNAADHGLETPEERRAKGKSVEGTIALAAHQEGAEVVISVRDDGAGIDRARVREKAEEAGLLAPGAAISDSALLQMIFQPGFSTAKQVTSLSGRGVGMDVVKRTVENLRGSLEISSTPQSGSVVSLRMPLTLAIIDGLLVRVGSGRYVIPLAAVEECVELSLEQDTRSSGRNMITLRDRLVPFIRLREQFATATAPDPFQKIVVVSTGTDRVGLVVDQILGDHQTVIKPLSGFHSTLGTFSGATILGDGSVALILDVAHLVAEGQMREARMRAAG